MEDVSQKLHWCTERISYQVGLEFSEIDVESAVKPQRGRDGRDDLADKTVEICVGWSFNVQIATANVVDGLVVDHEGAIGMFQCRVRGQNRVVGLHDSCRNLEEQEKVRKEAEQGSTR